MSRLDRCPHCEMTLQIICVRFQWNGTAIVSTCPNCAEVGTDKRKSIGRLQTAKKVANPLRVFFRASAMMDALNARFRNLLAFVVAALTVAALLRHVVHVYGGIAPADIRWFALVLLAPIVCVMLMLTARRSGD
jgi:hypothetical protein